MSILDLQIGQCGNQIGPTFFKTLSEEYSRSSSRFYDDYHCNPFFRLGCGKRNEPDDTPIARSILIDMEPSVVQSALVTSQKSSSKWSYSRQNCFVQQSGSGNNWAAGYSDYGPKVEQEVLAIVRRELEMADFFSGFLLMHSMAGGTGSGLGTFLTESICDNFPKNFCLNYCIWPYRLGEVIVQSYNAALTLSHLSHTSHSIFIAENDALSDICQKEMSLERPSFEEMNRQAMLDFIGGILPCKMRPISPQMSPKGNPGTWTRMVSDVISVLCPNPSKKLLSSSSLPLVSPRSRKYTSVGWEPLLRQVSKKLKSDLAPRFVVLRGREALSADLRCLAGICPVGRLSAAYSPAPYRGLDASLSIVTNSKKNAVPVMDVAAKAKKMLKSKAFVHRYEQFGINTNDILAAVGQLEDIVSIYGH